MGVCQCNEVNQDDRQLITVKHERQGDHDAFDNFQTKDNFLSNREGVRSGMPLEKEFNLEAYHEKESNSEFAQDCAKSYLEPNGVSNGRVDQEKISETPGKVVELPEKAQALKKTSVDKEENTFVFQRLSEDEELEYADFNIGLFRTFNDIRCCPSNYESTFDSRLKATLRKLNEEQADHILWSQKAFDIAYEYLNSLTDRKTDILTVHKYLNKRINEMSTDGETYSILTISHYGKNDNSTLFTLLTNNLTEARKALLENYSLGFFCSVPCSKNEDRTILCLVRKN